jgi:glycosyltransferase involved in cell wall biosynthesis
LKVLHLDRQRHWSGQQSRTVATAVVTRRRGHEVMIVTSPGSSYLARPELEGIRVETLRLRGLRLYPAILSLARVIRREKVDVIDAHGAVDQQVAIAARTMAGRGAVVRTKHNHTLLRGALSRLSYVRWTERIIAISAYVRGKLVESGVPEGHIDLVPDAVDCECFAPRRDAGEARRRFGLPAGAWVVGTSSRPSPRKGLAIVAAAVAKMRAAGLDVVWLAAGVTDREGDMYRRDFGLPPEAARTPGLVENVEEIFPALDAYVLPSLDEGMGKALLEALACEMPVVASNVGGVPEVVTDGETGLLVPPGDVPALEAALRRLHADRALGRALAAAGRRRIIERFEIGRMVDLTIASYERALEARRTRAVERPAPPPGAAEPLARGGSVGSP